MIENAYQYLVTKQKAAAFKWAIEAIEKRTDLHPKQKEAYLEAYKSTYEELMDQIGDYEEREGE